MRDNMIIKDDISVMCNDPSDGLTIEKTKSIYETIEDDSELAYLYSVVENTAWWYAHDIDDFKEGTEEYLDMCKKTDEWFSLANEIEKKIIDILTAEGKKVSEAGIREIVLPFMARNGYYDANGWWLEIGE
ncbi:MAG: hypothetical protein IKL07_01685 [Clostridium sp.]|nr:hypothetical protein [Clostridium sp.]